MAGTELTSTLTIVDKSSDVLERIANAAKISSNRMDELISTFDSIDDATSSVESLCESVENVASSLSTVTDEAKKTTSIFEKLKGVFDKGASVAGWLQTASMAADKFKSAMSSVDKNTNLIARLGQVARSEGIAMEDTDKWKSRAEEIRKMLSNQATELGVDTSEYTENAITFASNPAFKGIDEAARFSELMSKQFFASGVGGQAQMSVINQLTQGLSKGKLQGEDLMSILSNAPDVGTLLEKAYARLNNISFDQVEGKIRQLATDGELTADVTKNAFFGAADEIEKNFEEMPNTFEDMITKFKNQLTESLQPILKFLSNIGNSDSFKSILNSINRIIKTVIDLISLLNPVLEVALSVTAFISDKLADIISLDAFKRNTSVSGKKDDNLELKGIEQRSKILRAIDTQTEFVKKQAEAMSSVGDLQREFLKRQSEVYNYGDAYNARKEDFLKTYQQRMVDKEVADMIKMNPNMDEFSKRMLEDAFVEQYKTGSIFNDTQYKQASATYRSAEGEQNKLLSEIQKMEKWIDENRNTSNYEIFKRVEENKQLLHNAQKIFNESAQRNAEIAEALKIYEDRTREFLNQTVQNTGEIAKNTKSVSIDRDSIMFMKSMTTAEVINRYNNIHDSIAINNNYNSMPSKQKISGITQGELQGAINARRGA